MSLTVLAYTVADVAVRLADGVPEDEDVKAGWTAFAIFLLLIGAVAVLGFSLTKRLRRAQAAEEAGLYGRDEAATTGDVDVDGADDEGAEPEHRSTP